MCSILLPFAILPPSSFHSQSAERLPPGRDGFSGVILRGGRGL